MSTVNISLPDSMKEFVEKEVQVGGYGSVSEFVRALVRDYEKRKAKESLEEKLLEGLRSGPMTPLTKKDWDDLKRQLIEKYGRKKG